MSESAQSSFDADRLIAEARAGSSDAVADLLVRLSDYLRHEMKDRTLRDRSPSRSAADFIQDTLVSVQDKIASFPGQNWDELQRWAWRILYRRHQETRRNRRTRTSERMMMKVWAAVADRRNLAAAAGHGPGAEDALQQREEAARAYMLFQSKLKPHEQFIINLRLSDELPFKRIAEAVNREEDAVRKAYQRALARLRALMESNDHA